MYVYGDYPWGEALQEVVEELPAEQFIWPSALGPPVDAPGPLWTPYFKQGYGNPGSSSDDALGKIVGAALLVGAVVGIGYVGWRLAKGR